MTVPFWDELVTAVRRDGKCLVFICLKNSDDNSPD